MADPRSQHGADGPDDRLETILRAAVAAGASSSTSPAHGLADARSRMLAGVERRRRRRAGLLAGGGAALVLVLAGLGLSGALSGGGRPVAAPHVLAPSIKAAPLGQPPGNAGICRTSGSTRDYRCGAVSEVPSAYAAPSIGTQTTTSSAVTPGSNAPPTPTSNGTSGSTGATATVPASGGSGSTSSPHSAGTAQSILLLRSGHSVTVRLPSGGGARVWYPDGITSSPVAGNAVVTVSRIGNDELRITAQRAGFAMVSATSAPTSQHVPSCTADCPQSDMWTLNVEVTK